MARIPKPSGLNREFGAIRDLSKSRKPVGSRKYPKNIYVIVEGTKTEYQYFHCFKRQYNKSSVNITVESGSGKTDVLSLCEKAIKIKSEKIQYRQWDDELIEIWVVADYESPTNKANVDSAIDLCARNDIKLIISNPCFEYWYLLHFEDTTKPFFDAKSVAVYLEQYIQDYDKGKCYYWMLQPLINVAIGRIARFNVIDQNHWKNLCNPSTNVEKLITNVFFS